MKKNIQTIILIITLIIGGSLSLLVTYHTYAAATGDTFTVNSTLDEPDAMLDGICSSAPSGVCTLRAAIQEANNTVITDTIHLPAGTYLLTRTGDEDNNASGDLDIFTSMFIVGDGAETTIIDANKKVTNDRGIHVHDQNGIGNVELTISGVTIQNGVSVSGGGILLDSAALILDQGVVKDNTAYNESGTTRGGGIENTGGFLTVRESYIRNNISLCQGCPGYGGGIDTIEGGTAVIENSYIMDNESILAGGGIFNTGSLFIFNSVFWLNDAHLSGGGLYTNQGMVFSVNTTFTQNGAGFQGGGIYQLDGNIQLYNNTIISNDGDNDDDNAGAYGGIYAGSGTVTMRNSILAHNFGALNSDDDCGGSTLNSAGYNLIRTTTNCTIMGDTATNILGVDAGLDALNSNGGFTLTHALLPNSPAIDAGNPAGCVDQTQAFLLDTDQRGYDRHVDGGSGSERCDIGAYEYGATPPPTPTPSPTPPPTPTSTPIPEDTLHIYLPVIIR